MLEKGISLAAGWGLRILIASVLIAVGCAVPVQAQADDEVYPAEVAYTSLLKEAINFEDQATVVLLADQDDVSDELAADASAEGETLDKKDDEDTSWDGSLFGELEYRYRIKDPKDSPSAHDRDLGLLFGYEFGDHEHWDFALALSSVQADRPTSSWVALDRVTAEQWLALSEYWSRYSTSAASRGELRVQVGRFAYPFDATQLVFDSDLRVPCAYIEYREKPGGMLDQFSLSVLGAHLRDVQLPASGDAELLSLRVATRHEFNAATRLDAALAWHEFRSPAAIQAAVLAETWRIGGHPGAGETSNYTDETGNLVSDFELLDFWFELDLARGSSVPVSIEGEYVSNTAAQGPGAGRNAAYLVECKAGPDELPGDAQLALERVYIEPDAVLAATNRGTFATNYQSTRLKLSYIPAENVEWQFSHAWAKSIFSDAPLGAFSERDLRLYVTYSW